MPVLVICLRSDFSPFLQSPGPQYILEVRKSTPKSTTVFWMNVGSSRFVFSAENKVSFKSQSVFWILLGNAFA